MLNHGAIVALLAEEIEAARRSTGHRRGPGGCRQLRLFNDAHGHEAADEVLLRVAELVAAEGEGSHVARYGPDEFLLVRRDADAIGPGGGDGSAAGRPRRGQRPVR